MALYFIPALVAVALILTPVFVGLFRRNAGYFLVAFFLVAAVIMGRRAPGILAGDDWTFRAPWIRDYVPGVADGTAYFSLRADALSLFFVLLALVIGAAVFTYSARYFGRTKSTMPFYLLMTTFMVSIIMLVLADDVLLLFIAWEMVSLCSFFLIASAGPGGELGSIRTLLLTFTGGLFLLIAIGVMVAVTGSTELSVIIDSPTWQDHPTALVWVAILIALAAFTKSAQFPFHFWLPEAMAAATPVSAFLHAAAVVKAGIYLLLRFSGLFYGITAWHILLVVTGLLTAVMAAAFALQKHDLKKLTAYSTVSQLGWIVATIGIGTPFAIAAAVVHTLAHALFKSSLFMLAGIVDHQTGTRDMQRLGSIWRKLPFTFGSAVVAAASMAALPPLFGFVSKEGMLDAFLEAKSPTWTIVVIMLVATVGAILTFAYSFRFIFGGFVDGPREYPDVKEAPIALWLPAALPGMCSIPLGFAAGILDHPVDAISDAALGEVDVTHTHLALWHGLTIPLGITVVVVIAGVLMVLRRRQINDALNERELFPFTGAHALQVIVTAAAKFGVRCGKIADSLSPTRHLAWPFVVVMALAATVFGGWLVTGTVDGVELAPRVAGINQPMDYVSLLVIIIGVAATVRSRTRLGALLALSATGVGVTLQVLTLGAPDVALTQFLVELMTIAIIMLVVRLQPRSFQFGSQRRSTMAIIPAVGVGIASFLAVMGLIGRHGKPELAQWYLTNGPEISHGTNVVNTILVEFRALDTMGELAVLGMCGIAIAAVVNSIPAAQKDIRGTLPNLQRPALNAIPMQQLMRYLLPVLAILSLTIFMRGHNHPGGGFIAALVGAGALLLIYMARAKDGAPTSASVSYSLVGLGVFFAIFAGLLGYIPGTFLQPINGYLFGEFVTTALIFDLGVYLAVIGLVAIALLKLGGESRPGADSAAGPERHEGGFAPKPTAVVRGGRTPASDTAETHGDETGRKPIDTVEVE